MFHLKRLGRNFATAAKHVLGKRFCRIGCCCGTVQLIGGSSELRNLVISFLQPQICPPI